MAKETTHHYVRDSLGSRMRPGWCTAHNDFAWGYSEGSVSCFYDCVVEGASETCEFVSGSLVLPRGTIRGPRG